MKIGSQAGYTYAAVLLAVFAAALASAGGMHLFGNEVRREREAELMFVGDSIRRALERYHAKNPAGLYPFPRDLEWLLLDPNQPSLQRYLRRIYDDPMREPGVQSASATAGGWVLIRDSNGLIVGVHSGSMREPLRKDGFIKRYEGFRQARRYADWKFIAAGGVPALDPTSLAESGLASAQAGIRPPAEPNAPGRPIAPAPPPPAPPPPPPPPPAPPGPMGLGARAGAGAVPSDPARQTQVQAPDVAPPAPAPAEPGGLASSPAVPQQKPAPVSSGASVVAQDPGSGQASAGSAVAAPAAPANPPPPPATAGSFEFRPVTGF